MHIKENLSVLADMARSPGAMLTFKTLIFREAYDEGDNIKTFVFDFETPFAYEAGQYAVWFLPHFVVGKPVRLFSFASSPSEGDIALTTRISSTDYKKKLANLKKGEKVRINGPIGKFTLLQPPNKRNVFVVGGIGMTAARSLNKFIADKHIATKTTVLHSADGFYLYKDETAKISDEAIFTTREKFSDDLTRVIEKYSNDATYYVSGPPGFVDSAVTQLESKQITDIKRDGFLGY